MRCKYQKLDNQLLSWLHDNRENITTASVALALGISCPTTERHISRRFTHLEDRGVLQCKLQGTMRICSVVKDPPESLAKERWRPKHNEPAKSQDPGQNFIKANDSTSFEAAGGIIERLPSTWDNPAPQRRIGAMTFQDQLTTLD